MKLTEKQLEVMASDGHLLVTGGPGSGKTTISILKSADTAEFELLPQQKVLFLSFARASVSRVVEAIENELNIPKEIRQRIEVETYHSFFWRILKAHGYLVGLPRRLDILAPPAAAIALSHIRNEFGPTSRLSDDEKAQKTNAEDDERLRLARAEGRVCFDLFAPFVGELLHRSERLRKLIATMYPSVILDEFQDTNAQQWHVVQALGKFSSLKALADPEQRIYDFIGADPERLNHFREEFHPIEIDFTDANHRSFGTDIVKFGNEVLTGKFSQKEYDGLEIELFEPFANQAMTSLASSTYAARKRLAESGKAGWSLAILVPTKKFTRLVSDRFREPPAGMPPIRHDAVVELEAAILGAEIIAHLLQPVDSTHIDQFVELICNYYQGKGGEHPTKGALKEAARIRTAYEKWCAAVSAGKNPPGNSVLRATFDVYRAVQNIELTGNPDEDWRSIRAALEDGGCVRLSEIGAEVRNIRLLARGSQLRQNLALDWRDNNGYANALKIVKQAFIQEHFATGVKAEVGVVIMNMHKAKGKQFDEVIIFEGWPRRNGRGEIIVNLDRIVRNNVRGEVNDGSRQNFRVSVTRGRERVKILTPRGDPCVLLLPEK